MYYVQNQVEYFKEASLDEIRILKVTSTPSAWQHLELLVEFINLMYSSYHFSFTVS